MKTQWKIDKIGTGVMADVSTASGDSLIDNLPIELAEQIVRDHNYMFGFSDFVPGLKTCPWCLSRSLKLAEPTWRVCCHGCGMTGPRDDMDGNKWNQLVRPNDAYERHSPQGRWEANEIAGGWTSTEAQLIRYISQWKRETGFVAEDCVASAQIELMRRVI